MMIMVRLSVFMRSAKKGRDARSRKVKCLRSSIAALEPTTGSMNRTLHYDPHMHRDCQIERCP